MHLLIERSPAVLLNIEKAYRWITMCHGKHVKFVIMVVLHPVLAAQDSLGIFLELLSQVEETDAFGVVHSGSAEGGLVLFLGATSALLVRLVQLVKILLVLQVVMSGLILNLQRVLLLFEIVQDHPLL